jgi:CheY-like chemotaxis protein
MQDKCLQLGTALAYFTVFSLAPLVVKSSDCLVLLEALNTIRGVKPKPGGRNMGFCAGAFPVLCVDTRCMFSYYSAYARAEDRTRPLRAGFQLYMSKPVDITELVAVVANLAGRAADS